MEASSERNWSTRAAASEACLAAREEEERLRFESKAFNINTFRNKLTACSLVVYKCVHLQMENSTNVCYLAHGGGRLVVSMLAFYFDNMSSNRGLQFFL